jgi:hypothetical protein
MLYPMFKGILCLSKRPHQGLLLSLRSSDQVLSFYLKSSSMLGVFSDSLNFWACERFNYETLYVYSEPRSTRCRQTLNLDLFRPLRQWVSHLRVETPRRARKVAELIPAQCPFERDIVLYGRSIAHIPPPVQAQPSLQRTG